MNSEQRNLALRELLTHHRTVELSRVKEFRRDHDEEMLDAPGDDLDAARAALDSEIHVSLVELAEQRLKVIDDAFGQLERGLYGICADCSKEIALERLQALPFAICCIACQRRRQGGLPGKLTDEFATRWEIPQEMDETLEKQDAMTMPEEEMPVRDQSPFGPEQGEFEQLPPTPTAGRRGRIRARKEESEG